MSEGKGKTLKFSKVLCTAIKNVGTKKTISNAAETAERDAYTF